MCPYEVRYPFSLTRQDPLDQTGHQSRSPREFGNDDVLVRPMRTRADGAEAV